MSDGKNIVFITGANTGLGLATVKSLYESPSGSFHILAAGRTLSKVQSAIDTITSSGPSPGNSTLEAVVMDITSDASISAAEAAVASAHGRVDTLVNNAGGHFDNELAAGRMGEREAWNGTLELNVTSVQMSIVAFAPLLLQSSHARLLVITSGLASLHEEQTHTSNADRWLPKPVPGWPKPARVNHMWGYRTSKVALNMLFLQWVRIFEADPVKLFCISPGFLATGLGGASYERQIEAGAMDVSVGANFIRDVVDGKRDAEAGRVIRNHATQPW